MPIDRVSSEDEEIKIAHKAIRTNVERRKVRPNVPDVPIDVISFHHESSVMRWKFVVQRRLDVEREFSPKARQLCFY